MRKITPSYLAASFLCHNTWISRIIPDKPYLKILYKGYVGKKLNLDSPKSYNEKLQWLKLFDRDSKYTKLVDKYEVKKYVSSVIGNQYIIPTLGVWDSFDDIDFASLPDRFVLKCTHDSGGVVICKDKSTFDKVKAKRIIQSSLKKNFFYEGREWPYKNVKPRVIAEKYMEDPDSGELPDYKFFCFDGVVKALFIATDRQKKDEDTKFDFFDAEYNHLEFTNGHPMAKETPAKPKCFEEMKELAALLSKGIPQVRVDFYEVNGEVLFGELTFSHWSGLTPFVPEKWDNIFGSWINLPQR